MKQSSENRADGTVAIYFNEKRAVLVLDEESDERPQVLHVLPDDRAVQHVERGEWAVTLVVLDRGRKASRHRQGAHRPVRFLVPGRHPVSGIRYTELAA